jgi:hypothetical protein
LRSLGEAPFAVRGVTLGEPHPSPSKRRAGDQGLALESHRHQPQLFGGRAGSVDVAGRELDLHLRLEKGCPVQAAVRRPLLRWHSQGSLERVSYRRGRRGHVSFGQVHERETRLGIPSGAMCGEQGLLGAFDVSLT